MAIRKIISRSIGVDVIAAEDLAAGSVETAEIQNGAVTGPKLADNLNYDSGTLYLDSTNNRVGIGTTNPDGILHVNKDDNAVIRLTSGTESDWQWLASTTNGGWSPGDAFTLYEHSSGSTGYRFTIKSGGDVGIGETNPSSFLHLKKSDATTYDATDADGQVGIGPTIYLENPANSNITVGGQIVFGMRSTEAQARIGATGGASPELTFGTGDVERMRIDSNGRVGIGTDNPNTPVQVQNNSDTDYNPLSAAFNNILGLKNSTSGALNNSIMSFTTESNGEWYIGGVQNSSNNASDFVFVSRDSGSRAERMRITSNGDINHHTSGLFKIYRFNSSTNPYLNVGSIGCAYFNASSTDANAYAIVTNKDSSSTMHHICFKNINSVVGTISTSGSSTSYNTSSDYRLKDNVVEMTDATTRLKQLQPKRFNFIADADTTVDGFLAHEVQSVVPEAITGTHDEVDDDGNPVYQGIDQAKLVPLLVKSLQEALTEIDSLKARLDDAGL